jgi:hypothetical protein
MLRAIEGKSSKTLAPAGVGSLRQEASVYARWALRTAAGGHFKPGLEPKTKEQLEQENAVAIQSRVRSSFVANQYRSEMKARRAAATIVQAGFRSHGARSAIATQLLVEGPAAALLQGVVRGRKQRSRAKEEGRAATRVQSMNRGRKARARVGARRADLASMRAADGAAEAGGEGVGMVLRVPCADGMFSMPLGDAEPAGMVLRVPCADGTVSMLLGDAQTAAEQEEAMELRVPCVDGDVNVSLQLAEEVDDEPAFFITLFVQCEGGPLRLRLYTDPDASAA